jgi:hypothetical protein
VSNFDALAAKTLSSVFARFGQPAAYHPLADWPIPCCVIENKADEQTAIGETNLVAAQRVIEVRASEVERPEKGARFLVGSYHYVIAAQPRRDDPSGLVWKCLCRPAPADGWTPWRPLP